MIYEYAHSVQLLYEKVHEALGDIVHKVPGRLGGNFLWGLYLRTRAATVACVACHRRFQSVYQSTRTQGVGCDAKVWRLEGVWRWHLQGYYGSNRFDCVRFRWLREPIGIYRNADPLCDDCVQGLVDEGLLEKVPGDFP